MKIVKEEIFGPVITISPFTDTDKVIAEANQSEYGLSAGLFTKDITLAHQVAQKLKAGTIWVNCFNELHPQVPFGGFKSSGECLFCGIPTSLTPGLGIGRELGEYALENYTETKATHINLGKKCGFPG